MIYIIGTVATFYAILIGSLASRTLHAHLHPLPDFRAQFRGAAPGWPLGDKQRRYSMGWGSRP